MDKNDSEKGSIQAPNKTILQTIWEFASFGIIALLIVMPIRFFVAQPFIVSGSSMVPTFEDSDYLIIDEISYRLKDPKRFDVVVFRYPKDPTKYFIKRIMALPNEKITIEGATITIHNEENPDGFVLDQSFIKDPSDNSMSFDLNEDEYFVMGDNRNFSSDSRFWGPVNRDFIIGKAFIRLLPISNVDILPGVYQPADSQ